MQSSQGQLSSTTVGSEIRCLERALSDGDGAVPRRVAGIGERPHTLLQMRQASGRMKRDGRHQKCTKGVAATTRNMQERKRERASSHFRKKG